MSKESFWATNQSQLLPNSTNLKICYLARSTKYIFWQSAVDSSVNEQKLLGEQVIIISQFIYCSFSMVSLNTWIIFVSWDWKSFGKSNSSCLCTIFPVICFICVSEICLHNKVAIVSLSEYCSSEVPPSVCPLWNDPNSWLLQGFSFTVSGLLAQVLMWVCIFKLWAKPCGLYSSKASCRN